MDHVRACTGKYGEAWSGMMRTLRWLESLKQTRYQLIAYYVLGHLLIDLGLNREAAEQSERGLALATRERITFWRPGIEANFAIARLRLGDLDVGASLERAHAYCRENSEGHMRARCLEGLAEFSLARGDAASCIAHAEDLLAQVEPAGARELAAQARRWRGEALLAQGHHAEARRDLLLAAGAAEAIGRLRLAGDAHGALARLHDASHSRAEARHHDAEAGRVADRIARSLQVSEVEKLQPGKLHHQGA